jgi:hypothetical protein
MQHVPPLLLLYLIPSAKVSEQNKLMGRIFGLETDEISVG